MVSVWVCVWALGPVWAGGGFAALVIGRALIRAMHFGLCMRHLVHECLFIEEVLLVQRVPASLGDRPQPILVRFFHDGGRILVLVHCGKSVNDFKLVFAIYSRKHSPMLSACGLNFDALHNHSIAQFTR